MNLKQIDFFQPKSRTYWCNGTGRDTYIYINNGGFTTKASKPLMNLTRTSSLSRIGKSQISPKQIHYHSNGTGRDQYIVTDEGGFSRQFSPSKQFFSTTLRQYERMPSLPSLQNRDFFSQCQQKLSLLEQVKQRKLFQQQQCFIEKISVPKVNYQQLVYQNCDLMNQIDKSKFGKLTQKQREVQELLKPVTTMLN